MPLNENNITPDLKQIYEKKAFFSSHRVIVMTTEISLNCSYVQVFIAFVSMNNPCCSHIKKQKFLLNIEVNHMHYNATDTE